MTCSGWHQMPLTSMGCSGEGLLRANLRKKLFAPLCWLQKQCIKHVSDPLSLPLHRVWAVQVRLLNSQAKEGAPVSQSAM